MMPTSDAGPPSCCSASCGIVTSRRPPLSGERTALPSPNMLDPCGRDASGGACQSCGGCSAGDTPQCRTRPPVSGTADASTCTVVVPSPFATERRVTLPPATSRVMLSSSRGFAAAAGGAAATARGGGRRGEWWLQRTSACRGLVSRRQAWRREHALLCLKEILESPMHNAFAGERMLLTQSRRHCSSEVDCRLGAEARDKTRARGAWPKHERAHLGCACDRC